MLLRIEQWLMTDDRTALRHAICPARWIDADTEKPVDLAEWDGGGHVVLVTAVQGSAFVEIGLPDEFDPEAAGHLLREGESERWFTFAGKLMATEYKR
ncbi:hypothetical protein [Mesorhizobium sp.]|uniref:hypothetical protein n=1 Tax=Mesorhizobium sp. TaxID=1871066 RepID=UPI000FE76E7D|nr:hypothetical protein [Mesorhizobium sp.]RWP25043.1 MAG: hypothetical protein EOR02_30230 [Mesorhizobium sp.]